MCPNCGGQCIMGADLGLDEHQLRMENARLREEVYLPLSHWTNVCSNFRVDVWTGLKFWNVEKIVHKTRN